MILSSHCYVNTLSDFKRFHNSAEPNQPSLEARIEPTSPAALRRTAELLDTFSARRPSRRVIAVLGNITRATPSGVTRFPAGHRLAINTPPNSIKAEESSVLEFFKIENKTTNNFFLKLVFIEITF